MCRRLCLFVSVFGFALPTSHLGFYEPFGSPKILWPMVCHHIPHWNFSHWWTSVSLRQTAFFPGYSRFCLRRFPHIPAHLPRKWSPWWVKIPICVWIPSSFCWLQCPDRGDEPLTTFQYFATYKMRLHRYIVDLCWLTNPMNWGFPEVGVPPISHPFQWDFPL